MSNFKIISSSKAKVLINADYVMALLRNDDGLHFMMTDHDSINLPTGEKKETEELFEQISGWLI